MDSTVQTEVLFQEAQQAKKIASEALARGDGDAATVMVTGAEDFLDQALSAAPEELRGVVAHESLVIGSMKDRFAWDDINRLSKETRASFHERNRKRGR